MGHFTEFHYNVELIRNIPKDILDILFFMLEKSSIIFKNDDNLNIPNHPLFHRSDGWKCMLYSDSIYFKADTHSTLKFDDIDKVYYLCIRCNLKNYNNEIENFIDWIDPYIYAYIGDFLGFYRDEESEEPIIIRKK